jgi:ribosomal protein S18 acetylase RimI-like enzyme
MGKIVIRKPLMADLEQIQELNRKLIESDTNHDKLLNLDWSYRQGKKFLKKRINGGKFVCFVAKSGKTIVGYIAGSVKKTESWRPVKRAELEEMFIEKSYRRKGVGSRLVKEFMKWSRSKAVDRAVVIVYAPNKKGIGFYKKMKFEEDKISLEVKI